MLADVLWREVYMIIVILRGMLFSVSFMPIGSPRAAHSSSLNFRCDETEIIKNNTDNIRNGRNLTEMNGYQWKIQ